MAEAKKGDRVKINYTGKLEDGTIFDSNIGGAGCESDDCSTNDSSEGSGCGCESGPMELTVGEEELFTQIDEILVGMVPGEIKTVIIPAEDAFGEYDEEKVFTVSRADVPDDLNPAVGDELVLSSEDDEELDVVVVELSDKSITFDSNHPLAGEDLTFEVELLEIL
jgi:peptidylprolyl isomerase